MVLILFKAIEKVIWSHVHALQSQLSLMNNENIEVNCVCIKIGQFQFSCSNLPFCLVSSILTLPCSCICQEAREISLTQVPHFNKNVVLTCKEVILFSRIFFKIFLPTLFLFICRHSYFTANLHIFLVFIARRCGYRLTCSFFI